MGKGGQLLTKTEAEQTYSSNSNSNNKNNRETELPPSLAPCNSSSSTDSSKTTSPADKMPPNGSRSHGSRNSHASKVVTALEPTKTSNQRSSSSNSAPYTIKVPSKSALINFTVLCCGVAFGMGCVARSYIIPVATGATGVTSPHAHAHVQQISWTTFPTTPTPTMTMTDPLSNSKATSIPTNDISVSPVSNTIKPIHLMYEGLVDSSKLSTTTAMEALLVQVAHILLENGNDDDSNDDDHDSNDFAAFTCYQASHSLTCLGLLQDGDGHLTITHWSSSNDISIDFFQREMLVDTDTDAEDNNDSDNDDEDEHEDEEDDNKETHIQYMRRAGANLEILFRDNYGSDAITLKSSLPDTRKGIKFRGAPVAPSGGFPDIEGEYAELSTISREVVSIKSPFQDITILDIWDAFQQTTIRLAEKYQPEYVAKHPELFQPSRMLFLDGVIQSTRGGNAAYHEALVQPGMFAHPNPKRVAIIGGGECATLREVLRHNTIEHVIMIDIDPLIVQVSKEHLPDWNDCSMIQGSSRYCMDDPRATVLAMDAFAWFSDRFAHQDPSQNKIQEEPFDIIIMDALDPQNVVEFAGALYGDGCFLGSLYNGLTENGLLVSQVGESPDITDPPEALTENANRGVFMQALTDLGFSKIVEYQESHSEFYAPWSFAVSMRSMSTLANWYASEPEINLQLHKRLIPMIDGKSHTLEYFDGATMAEYRFPHKAQSSVYCRSVPAPAGCASYGHGFNPELPNIRLDTLPITNEDIAPVAYVGLERSVHQTVFRAPTTQILEGMASINGEQLSRPFKAFLNEYGQASQKRGATEWAAQSSITSAVNSSSSDDLHTISTWSRAYDPNGQRHATGIIFPSPTQTASLVVPSDSVKEEL